MLVCFILPLFLNKPFLLTEWLHVFVVYTCLYWQDWVQHIKVFTSKCLSLCYTNGSFFCPGSISRSSWIKCNRTETLIHFCVETLQKPHFFEITFLVSKHPSWPSACAVSDTKCRGTDNLCKHMNTKQKTPREEFNVMREMWVCVDNLRIRSGNKVFYLPKKAWKC